MENKFLVDDHRYSSMYLEIRKIIQSKVDDTNLRQNLTGTYAICKSTFYIRESNNFDSKFDDIVWTYSFVEDTNGKIAFFTNFQDAVEVIEDFELSGLSIMKEDQEFHDMIISKHGMLENVDYEIIDIDLYNMSGK